MAKQSINIGSVANDGTGDNLRAGAIKVNANTDELYTALGTGSALSIVSTSDVNYLHTIIVTVDLNRQL